MHEDYNQKKKKLVESLTSNNLLKDKRLYKAFLEIPLEEFIPRNYQDPLKIYQDIPNLFYYHDPNNYRTISAPHMITIMLQGLALERDDDLLILGAKSGYIAALAHELAPQGEIIILEANSEIANLTEENLQKLDLDHNITVIVKNPLEGMPDLTPWQKILVTGAIKQSRITPLLRQLDKNEGVLYAPIGEGLVQTYTQILRVDNNFYGKKQLQVRFTPLMTQVELDELELITDLDEYEEVEVEINPKKVDKTLEKINIKYETNVF
jgi:protein-L-isoaspartate(D-aspartate) O-methyltransferase